MTTHTPKANLRKMQKKQMIEACPIPEEAVESILAHYESFGEGIETKTFKEALRGTRESYVW